MFPQTKPQQHRKSEKDVEDGKTEATAGLPEPPSQTEAESEMAASKGSQDWDAYDCVDGDVLDLSIQSSVSPPKDEKTPPSQSIVKNGLDALLKNGHNNNMVVVNGTNKAVSSIVPLDLAPMLEMYSSPKDLSSQKEAKPLILETPGATSPADSDVIIQGRRPIFSESE